jgi:tetratricopeptide (TPR) repeat protein
VEEGNALLSGSGDARAHALFCYGTGSALLFAGRLRAAALALEQGVARADETDEPALRAQARSPLALAHALAGSSDQALALTEEAIEILGGPAAARANPSPLNPYTRLLSYRGWALARSGRLAAAHTALEQALDAALESEEGVLASLIQTFFADLETWRGSPSAALAHARQSVEYAERLGAPLNLANAYPSLGWAYLGNGQPEEARAALEHALAIAPSYVGTSWALSGLAEACARLGHAARAREVAAEAVAVADRDGVRHGSVRLSPARVLRMTDGLSAQREIEAALDRALVLIEETGSRVYVPQVREERAELARLRGDEATRERELRDAHRLYTEMGATGHAERLAEKLGL